jgi:hypothetical protein
MKPEIAQKRVEEWQARHGFAHPLTAYYDMQAQAEAHREVWDMGYQGGQDEAAEALAAMTARAEKAEKAETSLTTVRDEWEQERRVRLDAENALRLVRTDIENVWRWQGDGYDDPTTLSCPVIMSADTVRALVARAEKAEAELRDAREDLREITETATELQRVVDAYGENGATVCVKAGDRGEVDMWSDGHAHALVPLSSLRYAEADLAAARRDVERLSGLIEAVRAEALVVTRNDVRIDRIRALLADTAPKAGER